MCELARLRNLRIYDSRMSLRICGFAILRTIFCLPTSVHLIIYISSLLYLYRRSNCRETGWWQLLRHAAMWCVLFHFTGEIQPRQLRLFAIHFAAGYLVSLIERKKQQLFSGPWWDSLLPHLLKVRNKISAFSLSHSHRSRWLLRLWNAVWVRAEALPRLCQDEGKAGGCIINTYRMRRPGENLVGRCFAKKLSGWGKSWRLYDWHVADEAAGWEISWLLFGQEIVRMRSKMAAASPRYCQDEEQDGCYFAEKWSGWQQDGCCFAEKLSGWGTIWLLLR